MDSKKIIDILKEAYDTGVNVWMLCNYRYQFFGAWQCDNIVIEGSPADWSCDAIGERIELDFPVIYHAEPHMPNFYERIGQITIQIEDIIEVNYMPSTVKEILYYYCVKHGTKLLKNTELKCGCSIKESCDKFNTGCSMWVQPKEEEEKNES